MFDPESDMTAGESLFAALAEMECMAGLTNEGQGVRGGRGWCRLAVSAADAMPDQLLGALLDGMGAGRRGP